MRSRARLAAASLAAALAAPLLSARAEEPPPDGWRAFKATWTLSGTRQLLPTEGSRPANIINLSGPLVVTAGEGLGRGFLGEVIGFDDGGSLLVARALLTDGKENRIYATLKAEPLGPGRKATGTITGGTGRYAGIEGTFGFSWQYIVSPESSEIDAHIANIEGRTRIASPAKREAPR